MSKRFQRGLVVGKFAPLHRGHELVINRAFDACEEVVIISYCKPEFAGCDAARRQSWLAELFPTARILLPNDASLAALPLNGPGFREVPANNADEATHRRFCGFLCANVLGLSVDAVFTSEDYGDAFAEELTRCFREHGADIAEVQHLLVDQRREIVPVSGSLLREDVHGHRQFLSPAVYGSFVERVCLLGGESSGKSTLAQALAKEFATQQVTEYGRVLWEARNGLLAFDDMLRIARRQVALEEEAARRANRFLFCDTSPLTTLFYSRHLFGRAGSELERLANRSYGTVVLCAPDFPFIQDGTRQPESFRALQHEWYLRELAAREIPFVPAQGTLADRVQIVSEWLLRRSF
jgi:NadR type nicotinamide-nucleotide adenylyltransferase